MALQLPVLDRAVTTSAPSRRSPVPGATVRRHLVAAAGAVACAALAVWARFPL